VAGLFRVLHIYLISTYIGDVPFLEQSFPAGNIADIVLSRKAMGEIYFNFHQKNLSPKL
jgi:hypothetical protein